MTEIEQLLKLNYEQCCYRLLCKYGTVKKDYFDKLSFERIVKEIFFQKRITYKLKKNKVTRGKEGLYIHHIDEDKAILLSIPEYALKNPFFYQKSDRLVYCNLLEHLVLHIKILEFSNPQQNQFEKCGIGGIKTFIVPELNDIYSGIQYQQFWKKQVIKNILSLKKDYLLCVNKIMQFPNLNIDFLFSSLIFNQLSDIGWCITKNKEIFKEFIKLGLKNNYDLSFLQLKLGIFKCFCLNCR